MFRCCLNKKSDFHNQSGMTLVITLLLMLTLTLMASAITFVVNNHSDLTNSVTQRPLAMDSASTCIDQALTWMQTSTGKSWLAATEVVGATAGNDFYGVGADQDLAADGGPLSTTKSLVTDTAISTGDTRGAKFMNRMALATCTSVRMTVVKKIVGAVATSQAGIGGEAGTVNEYDSSTAAEPLATYTILIVSEGIFNAPIIAGGGIDTIDASEWTQNSSKATIEVAITYEV